jgi:hypothetical protein
MSSHIPTPARISSPYLKSIVFYDDVPSRFILVKELPRSESFLKYRHSAGELTQVSKRVIDEGEVEVTKRSAVVDRNVTVVNFNSPPETGSTRSRWPPLSAHKKTFIRSKL